MTVYPITPVAKPRQTRKDQWAKRPGVLQYRAFADECRLRAVMVRPGDRVTFGLPMPRSWPDRSRKNKAYTPHTQTPDLDNLLKALLDAVHQEDCAIWSITAVKVWSWVGCIVVRPELDRPAIPVELIDAMDKLR